MPNLEELMKAVFRLFVFLRASHLTFSTRIVALAANVSTSFTLRWIVARPTVTMKLDENCAAIESGLGYNRILIGFPNKKSKVSSENKG